MWPLIRGVIGAAVGYLVGATLVVLFTANPVNSEFSLVLGYCLALVGWLFGIGLADTWLREWLGLPAREQRYSRWRKYLSFNTDHKVIGTQYLVTFLAVLALGGLAAMLIRIELYSVGETIMTPDRYNQVMSFHGIFMVAVAVATVLGAFGNYMVPLQIGANDMAFPRLNAVSFWLVPPVAVALLAAPTVGSFDFGWTAYPPYATGTNSGAVLFMLAVITFGLSSIFGGINIIATVATMRAPGLTWGRLPIFVWGCVAASILSITTTQFFAASLVLELMDRVAGTVFFDAGAGGSLLYEHLFWFYSHPAVYVMVLPSLGMMLELISHMSRKPLFAYRAAVIALMAIVGLSTVVWAHHMFTSGMANYLHAPFMFLTEMISIPTGVIFLSALGTMWRGKLKLEPPLLLAFIWVFQFLMGGVTGIFLADVATDLQLHDTYFVVAHFHYTIMGGVVFGLLAGIHYWFPKLTGRMYNKRLANFVAVWVGLFFQLTFIPQFWLGTNGMNRRVADYLPGLEGANRFSSISAFCLGLGALLFFYNMVNSAIRGPKCNQNPWNATTLEWQVSSPPPEHNFPTVPEVLATPYTYGDKSLRHVREMEAEPAHAGAGEGH